MNWEGLKKSPWCETREEATTQQNLIKPVVVVARESRENRGEPSVGVSALPPNICALSWTCRRGSARSTGTGAIISPSPERENVSVLRRNGPPLVISGQSLSANMVEASTTSHSLSTARETSKVVEALVEALSTSSWSSDSDGSGTQPEGGFASIRDAVDSRLKVHSRSESPRETILSDVAQRHRVAADIAKFFFKATHIVASEFEGRQSIVFGEFSEFTELVSHFVCRMTLTSLPL